VRAQRWREGRGPRSQAGPRHRGRGIAARRSPGPAREPQINNRSRVAGSFGHFGYSVRCAASDVSAIFHSIRLDGSAARRLLARWNSSAGLHRVPWVGWLEFSEGSECKNSTHPPPDFPVKSASVTGILPFFLLILKEFKDHPKNPVNSENSGPAFSAGSAWFGRVVRVTPIAELLPIGSI
jgi:hypothetical protein